MIKLIKKINQRTFGKIKCIQRRHHKRNYYSGICVRCGNPKQTDYEYMEATN
jgi:hypothetical protein